RHHISVAVQIAVTPRAGSQNFGDIPRDGRFLSENSDCARFPCSVAQAYILSVGQGFGPAAELPLGPPDPKQPLEIAPPPPIRTKDLCIMWPKTTKNPTLRQERRRELRYDCTPVIV